jgi:hypothetical protein
LTTKELLIAHRSACLNQIKTQNLLISFENI